MDHRSNNKFKTIKFREENIGENLCDLVLSQGVFDVIPKTWLIKEKKLDNQTSLKLKIPLKGLENKPQIGRKYLQNTYLIRDLYSKYTNKLSELNKNEIT